MVLVGYTLRDAVRMLKCFDMSMYDPYERDDDPEPVLIGAWVMFVDDEIRYVSFGSWVGEGDTDEYGVPDESIYFYTDGDYTLVDEGMTLGGVMVDRVIEWVWS
jgi:hypothetical protein